MSPRRTWIAAAVLAISGLILGTLGLQRTYAAGPIYQPVNVCDAATVGQCVLVGSDGHISATASLAANGTLLPNTAALADATANPTTTLIGAIPFGFNGATYDRQYNNTSTTLLASAGRTSTQTSADQTNYNSRGIHVIVDVTTIGTGSITMTLNGKDPASGKYYLLLSGVAITSNSTNIYRLYPGIATSVNANASDILPRTFQIVITANNANSVTYSVGYNLDN